jgi:predicted RNA-binding Zn-ribbon protein involved in translation (DUF1610 family)
MKSEQTPDASVNPAGATSEHQQALLLCLSQQGARCVECGYDLRGVSRLVCPECGHAITWESLISRKHPGMGSWLTCIIAISALLPESLVQWQYIAYKRQVWYDVAVDWEWRTPYYLGEWAKALPSTVLWLGAPSMLALLLLFRRRWALLPQWLRRVAAALSVLVLLWAYRRWQFWYQWWPWADEWWRYPRLWFLGN